MEVFQPLTDFFETILDDNRIGVTHISIYVALLYKWNLNGNSNPVSIHRKWIMKSAKINARQTYNKCMRELHAYGYIKYYPSANPVIASSVYLNRL